MIEPFVNLIIVSASGYTIKQHHESAIRTMHQRFRREHQADYPLAEILYREHKADWKSLALRLHQVAVRNCPVIFVGHSWGCGDAYRRFEKEWYKCGRVIDRAFLIDPVPRPFRFLPLRLANVSAYFGRGVFPVEHARHVTTWRQVNNLPMGRRVRVPDAHVLDGTVYGSPSNIRKYAKYAHPSDVVHDMEVQHSTIDDLSTVQTTILEEVDSYIDIVMSKGTHASGSSPHPAPD
jgi:hypothetical protein